MKIILLRHEERNLSDPRFFVNLTEKGKINSIKLINILNNFSINDIYCSPFERTIETILPYCLFSKKKINIENSLYEVPNNILFINEIVYSTLNIRDINSEIINYNYKSYMRKEEFSFSDDNIIINYETNENIYLRCKNFIENIINDNYNKNKTILLVSHQRILTDIEKYIIEKIYKNYDYTFSKMKMGEYRIYSL